MIFHYLFPHVDDDVDDDDDNDDDDDDCSPETQSAK